MASDKEIRIQVIAEINANGTPITSRTNPVTSLTPITPQVQNNTPTSIPNQGGGFGQAISASFLIQSGRKLISASGNSQISQAIGNTVKYGTLTLQLFNPATAVPAALTMAVELASQALQKVNELKQEAQMNNQAQYNQIIGGSKFLGAGNFTTSTDFYGNITYNKK